MLRTDRKAEFVAEGAWFWKRHRFQAGKLVAARPLGRQALAQLEAEQRERPVPLIQGDARQWWWYRDCFYWEDEGLSPADVMALVLERERRKERKLERAHAALHQERNGTPRREPIPREVRLAVWERDGGRCVECGSGFDLQYDHVIPFAMRGATTVQNLQLLCASCNREKGAAL
jgi:5-methylcytosine-specific restriction endonuclease McrA